MFYLSDFYTFTLFTLRDLPPGMNQGPFVCRTFTILNKGTNA